MEELKPQADDERKHGGYAIPCPKHPVRNPDQHVMGQNARPCPYSLDIGKAASSGTASNTGLQPWSKNHPLEGWFFRESRRKNLPRGRAQPSPAERGRPV